MPWLLVSALRLRRLVRQGRKKRYGPVMSMVAPVSSHTSHLSYFDAEAEWVW